EHSRDLESQSNSLDSSGGANDPDAATHPRTTLVPDPDTTQRHPDAVLTLQEEQDRNPPEAGVGPEDDEHQDGNSNFHESQNRNLSPAVTQLLAEHGNSMLELEMAVLRDFPTQSGTTVSDL
ncbi:unnamed protein product, partial [Amoebophrya sp. A25]